VVELELFILRKKDWKDYFLKHLENQPTNPKLSIRQLLNILSILGKISNIQAKKIFLVAFHQQKQNKKILSLKVIRRMED
jgi:hypothetical protein